MKGIETLEFSSFFISPDTESNNNVSKRERIIPSSFPTSNSENDYQEFFKKIVMLRGEDGKFTSRCFGSIEGADTSIIDYLDGRKPDISFFVKDSIHISMNVEIVGEIKPRDKFLQNASIGELFTFQQRVLKENPHRDFCHGFLTDCDRIIFTKLEFLRAENKNRYIRTPTYYFKDCDTTYFQDLLYSDLPKLGYSSLHFNTKLASYEITERLVTGLTSYVWKSDIYAAKEYKSDWLKVITTEIQNLKTLSGLECIPTLVDSGEKFIVMKPVCKPIESFTIQTLTAILEVLKNSYKRGLVHRDLRLTNMMVIGGQIVINDWGFAVEDSTTGSYSGSICYAADEIIESGIFLQSSHCVNMIFICLQK